MVGQSEMVTRSADNRDHPRGINSTTTVTIDNDTSSIPYRVKKKRTRGHTGCVTCRARKVKCDERPGSCSNCQRLGVECSGYMSGPLNRSMRLQIIGKSSPDGPLTEAGTRRIRLPESCKSCRSAKTKCSGVTPACSRCVEKKVECHYETARRSQRNKSDSLLSEFKQHRFLLPGTPGTRIACANGGTLQEVHKLSQYEGSQQDHHHQSSKRSRIVDTPLVTEDYSWLCSSELPDEKQIYELIEAYFANIHPLRCFGFIHKPSFMERLDRGLARESGDNSLVHVMCAHGARFYMLERIDSRLGNGSECLSVGNAWAEKAKQMLFRDLNKISIENLMVAVLLHDYQLRIGDYAAAFMLSGTTARMAQAMQINLEYSPDILCTEEDSPLSPCARETRRRLMWSCYVMDSWVGSGVDQLTLFQDRDIKIQLPCNERNFLQQTPCVTETLAIGQGLRFLPEELKSMIANENIGMVAQFVRIAEIRKKVLRYLKGIDITQSSKLPDAEFASLGTAFKEWYEHLPPLQRLTTTNIYIRKDSNQLGALFLLHCAYHLSTCDLYRIGDPRLLPSLFRFHFSIGSRPEQQSFLKHCREICFEHAKKVANILAQAADHGTRMLADSWLCTAAYETIRIMVFYIMKDNCTNFGAQISTGEATEVLHLIHSNMKALRLMKPLFATAENCYKAARCVLKRSGFDTHLFEENMDQENPDDFEGPPITNHSVQITPESVLNPLSIYSLARKGIEEKHTPELGTPTYSSTMTSPSDSGANIVLPRTELYSQDAPPPFPLLETQPAQPQSMVTSAPFAPYVNSNLPVSSEQSLLWQSGLDDFSMNFLPGLDYSWQWAETVQEGIESRGFPPACQ